MTIEILLETIRQLAQTISVPPDLLPNRTPIGFEFNEIEEVDNGYQMTWYERGSILGKKDFQTPDQVIYAYFHSATRSMAQRYARDNAVGDEDLRRLQHRQQIELMTALNPNWQSRIQSEIDAQQQQHPYDDRSIWVILGGNSYRNALTVLQRFCGQHQLEFWLPDIEAAIEAWDEDHSTQGWIKSCQKKVGRTRSPFLLNPNIEPMPALPFKPQVLKIYLEWLKKYTLGFAETEQLRTDQYRTETLWGWYCHEGCHSPQTTEAHLDQYVAIEVIQLLLTENLPQENKLELCDLGAIVQSEVYIQTQRLIRLLTAEFTILREQKQAENCVLCKRKAFQSQWKVVRDPNGYYLSTDI